MNAKVEQVIRKDFQVYSDLFFEANKSDSFIDLGCLSDVSWLLSIWWKPTYLDYVTHNGEGVSSPEYSVAAFWEQK